MNTSQEDTIASIKVMRMQEETTYQCSNYFFQQQMDEAVNGPQHIITKNKNIKNTVDASCRFKMAEWFFQVIDFCKFDRETVAISMSFLDRYLMTDEGKRRCLQDKKEYQLAAMTCLYTAVKINEPEAMDPKVVAGLSRGVYTEDQVTDMEVSILQALEWRVNPPTALSFVRAFFQLLSNNGNRSKNTDMYEDTNTSQKVTDAAFELARFQTDLAVTNYDFCTVNASTIAIAAIVNAFEVLEELNAPNCNAQMTSQEHLCKVATLLEVPIDSPIMKKVQNTLYESIRSSSSGPLGSKWFKNGKSASSMVQTKEKRNSLAGLSPRSIQENDTIYAL